MAVLLLVRFLSGLFDLLLLFLNQKGLHRVIVIVVVYQLCQLSLFVEHGSLWCLVVAVLVLRQRLAFLPLDVFPADLELVLVLVIARRVSGVVHAQQSPGHLCAAEIVDSEIRALLVLVLEPPESLGLARLLVAHKLQEHGLAKLRKDGNYIALGELVGQAAKVDVCGIAVIGMPRGVGGAANSC